MAIANSVKQDSARSRTPAAPSARPRLRPARRKQPETRRWSAEYCTAAQMPPAASIVVKSPMPSFALPLRCPCQTSPLHNLWYAIRPWSDVSSWRNAPGNSNCFANCIFPCLLLNIAVHDLARIPALLQRLLYLFRQHHRTMLSAGAAEGDGQIAFHFLYLILHQ